jgi:hypothetical protein
MKDFKFKLGEKTRDVWAGDLVHECEYIADMGQGRMLFYDIKNKCFRRVFLEMSHGKVCMNGWDCSDSPSKLM